MVYLLLVAVYLTLWLIPTFKGNKWLEESLSKRGYELTSTAQAERPDAAIAQLTKSA